MVRQRRAELDLMMGTPGDTRSSDQDQDGPGLPLPAQLNQPVTTWMMAAMPIATISNCSTKGGSFLPAMAPTCPPRTEPAAMTATATQSGREATMKNTAAVPFTTTASTFLIAVATC